VEMFRDLDGGAEAFVNGGTSKWHRMKWSAVRLKTGSVHNNPGVL
jgi:hypothetical protein